MASSGTPSRTRRDAACLADDGPGGLDHQRAGEPHRPVRMRPAARGERRAVAAHEVDRVRRNAKLVRHHLPEAGLVALPARLRSDDEVDGVGRDGDLDALVRHADRGLDIIGDADSQEPAALLRLGAALGESLPVRDIEHAREVRGEFAAVVGEPGGSTVGQFVMRDQIAAAQLDPIDLQAAGRDVEHALHHGGRLGAAGAAERRGRHRVGHDRAQPHAGDRHVVDRRRDPVAVAERHVRDCMRTGIGGELEVHRQDAAALVEAEPRLGRDIARVVVGEERLGAVAGPFHRPFQRA